MIVRKKDLNYDETREYNKLINEVEYTKILLNGSEAKKMEILKPVLAYMYNVFFNQWHYPQQTKKTKKITGRFIKWYFDRGLVSDETQLAIIKKNRDFDTNSFKYEFVDIHKKTLKEIIRIDPRGLLDYALNTGDQKLVMRVIKHKPDLYYRFRSKNHKERLRGIQLKDRTFTVNFINKVIRVAVLQAAMRKTSAGISIPIDTFTQTFCERYVSESGSNLRLIPKDRRTEHVCRLAVAKAGTALQHVPNDLKTEEMCSIALKNSPTALKYMTAEQQKSKLVLRALLQNGNASKYMKKKACKK